MYVCVYACMSVAATSGRENMRERKREREGGERESNQIEASFIMTWFVKYYKKRPHMFCERYFNSAHHRGSKIASY